MNPAGLEAGHFLTETIQLHVPRYQRAYEWDDERWNGLWLDLGHIYQQKGRGAPSKTHFMGVLLLEPRTAPAGSGATAKALVDGQQRLLTLLILLAALRDHDAGLTGKPVDAVNELNTITSRYAPPIARFVPKPQDGAVLSSMLEGKFQAEIPDHYYDLPIAKAYRFFRYQLWVGMPSIERAVDPPRPSKKKAAPPRGSYTPWPLPAGGLLPIDIALMHAAVTSELRFHAIELDGTDEESTVVFETMNARSTPLSQFDLLRNAIEVRMPNRGEAFYNNYWRPVEDIVAKTTYKGGRGRPEEKFFYEYLLSRGTGRVSQDELHRRFMDEVIATIGYARNAVNEGRFEQEFAVPLANAGLLYPIAIGKSPAVTIRGTPFQVSQRASELISELMSISAGPPVPLMLRAVISRFERTIDDGQLDELLLDLESFLVREMLCGEDFSPLRATLANVVAAIGSPLSVASVRSALKQFGWKTNADVVNAVKSARLDGYGSGVFPVLRGIERRLAPHGANAMPYGRGPGLYSIEHIYPQGSTPKAWTMDLLHWRQKQEDMDARKFVLGNLTAVTNYDNQKNGRLQLAAKKKQIQKAAPLKLHNTFMRVSKWTAAAIDQRSDALAHIALSEWPPPP